MRCSILATLLVLAGCSHHSSAPVDASLDVSDAGLDVGADALGDAGSEAALLDEGTVDAPPFTDTTLPLGTELRGFRPTAACPREANPAASDAAAQWLEELGEDGVALGFLLDSTSSISNDAAQADNQWEGIQRLGCGQPYLVLTRSNDNAGEPSFVVVRLGSRPLTGAALGSNLSGCTPDAREQVVYSRPLVVDDPSGYSSKEYKQAGGFQLIGDYAAVPAVDPAGDKSPYVVFYSFAKPEAPRFKYAVAIEAASKRAGAVGLVKTSDGTYAMAVSGDSEGKALLFYRSRGTSLVSNPRFQPIGTWNESTAGKAGWIDERWGDYQSINLVSDSSGQLWLVGMYRSSSGTDWVDIYELKLVAGAPTAPFTIGLTKRYAKRFYPPSQYCFPKNLSFASFNAATGLYVSPFGKLYLYAAEPWDSLPDVNGYEAVALSEFAY